MYKYNITSKSTAVKLPLKGRFWWRSATVVPLLFKSSAPTWLLWLIVQQLTLLSPANLANVSLQMLANVANFYLANINIATPR